MDQGSTQPTYSWHTPDLEASVFGYADGTTALIVSRRGQQSAITFGASDARMIGRALEQASRMAKPGVTVPVPR